MIGIVGLEYKSSGSGIARAIKSSLPEAKLAGFGLRSHIGIFSDVFDLKVFVDPMDIEKLVSICISSGISGFIPAGDLQVEAYSEVHEIFQSTGIQLILPENKSVRIVNDKYEFYQFAKRVGFNVPRTSKSFKDLCYPIVVKGKRKGTYIAKSEKEVEAGIGHIKAIGEIPIFQEFLSGNSYSVAGFISDDFSVFLCIKKLLVDIDGTTLAGIVIDNKELIETSNELAHKLGWRGPFEVEFMVSDETPYIIEMNSRYPFWISACSKIKPNLPLIHYCLLTGKEIGDVELTVGKMFFLEHSFSVCDFTDVVGHL